MTAIRPITLNGRAHHVLYSRRSFIRLLLYADCDPGTLHITLVVATSV